MRKRHRKPPVWIIPFGIGLIVACYCPPKALIAVLAISMVYLGIICLKC